MNILKLNSILPGIFSIAIIAILLVACENETISPQEAEAIKFDETTYTIAMQKGMTEAEANNWFENLTEDELNVSINNADVISEDELLSRGCYWTSWQNYSYQRCGHCSNSKSSTHSGQVRYRICDGQYWYAQYRYTRVRCHNPLC